MFKNKFKTKCKTCLKLTKARLELIQRKRDAMQKYLKKDIADLLKAGHDYNAYGRVEGFVGELNLSSCYDFVEQSCACISNHLSAMSKQRECPEECREAVSTLMFAAARFADLPELSKLRNIFTERYEKSVESYVNKEFVAKLKSEHPTKDVKFQVMQDIAQEYGIDWNTKALEQQLYKPPAPEQDEPKHASDDKYKQNNLRSTAAGRKQDLPFNEKGELTNNGHQVHKSRKSPIDNLQGKTVNQDRLQNSVSSSGNEVDDNEKKNVSYSSIPPPYTRPEPKPDAAGVEPRKLNDKLDKEPKAKPRSVRSRPAKALKLPPGNDNIDTGAKGIDEIRRKKDSDGKKQGGGHDQSNEEEKMMDQLLIHYSKKKSPLEPVKEEPKAKQEYSHRSREKSLPVEPSSPTETEAGPAGATSFEQDMRAKGHIHPNLPDYDDFVARLAALRGEGK